MASQKSKTALGVAPVATVTSAGVTGVLFEHVVSGALAAGDIIEMGPIEPGIKPVDATLITDDLDSNGAPTITLSVGILNAAGTDLDAAATSTFIAASTAGQTGGIARATSANVYLAGASNAARKLGIKVVAGPATAASDGKKIAVKLDVQG